MTNEFGTMPGMQAVDLQAATAAVTTYQAKLLEIAQANTKFAFEYSQALAGIRSPADFISVTTEYTKKRMEMFTQHSKELAELVTKR
jgi:hypothetical protein